ncbi:MAG: hypothetical protein GF408_03740 [Candidatus Omnitrophica bacterium]|nr:hypothetical protein [Candidatus Omnitrophota bacterium]
MRRLYLLIIFLSVSSVVLPARSDSAQFENREWGQSKQEVISLLEASGKPYKLTPFNEIKYKDTMFGYPCEAMLVFSEEYGLYDLWLAMTGNTKEVSDAESRAVSMLTARHGPPPARKEKEGRGFITVTYRWYDSEEPSEYPDIELHVTKRHDGTGAVFLRYREPEVASRIDREKAGLS